MLRRAARDSVAPEDGPSGGSQDGSPSGAARPRALLPPLLSPPPLPAPDAAGRRVGGRRAAPAAGGAPAVPASIPALLSRSLITSALGHVKCRWRTASHRRAVASATATCDSSSSLDTEIRNGRGGACRTPQAYTRRTMSDRALRECAPKPSETARSR